MPKIAFTIPEACEFSGLGRSSLYRLFEQGAYPRPSECVERWRSDYRTLLRALLP